MLRFYAHKFVDSLDDLSAIRVLAVKEDPLTQMTVDTTTRTRINNLIEQLSEMKLGMTVRSAERLREAGATATAGHLQDILSEIQGRLRDELENTLMFCIRENAEYFEPKEPLFGKEFEDKFATHGIFELDEAGKCLALGRDTAAVFHLMRIMEIGIRAVAKSLGIPDPIKPSNRNWHQILKSIKDENDARVARKAKSWKDQRDKEFFVSAYVSLDAVRVAWRNPTMHIENKYTPDEAGNVFLAVRGFMKKLASRMDENGQPVA
jgi:hypothetical protein